MDKHLQERIAKAKENFMDSVTAFSKSWERKRKQEEKHGNRKSKRPTKGNE